MKSAELHRRLVGGLGAYFRGEGFRRAGATQSGWHRGDLLVWFQCDKWGWDRYAGSSFFVNFQRGPIAKPWSGETRRLQEFLAPAELERARDLQNAVIARLTLPPPEIQEMMQAAFAKTPDSAGLFDAWLSLFRPVAQPYRANQDFSLRYFDELDVDTWCGFLLNVLPRIVEE